MLVQVLHYIESIRAFHENSYLTFGHIKYVRNLDVAL